MHHFLTHLMFYYFNFRSLGTNCWNDTLYSIKELNRWKILRLLKKLHTAAADKCPCLPPRNQCNHLFVSVLSRTVMTQLKEDEECMHLEVRASRIQDVKNHKYQLKCVQAKEYYLGLLRQHCFETSSECATVTVSVLFPTYMSKTIYKLFILHLYFVMPQLRAWPTGILTMVFGTRKLTVTTILSSET